MPSRTTETPPDGRAGRGRRARSSPARSSARRLRYSSPRAASSIARTSSMARAYASKSTSRARPTISATRRRCARTSSSSASSTPDASMRATIASGSSSRSSSAVTIPRSSASGKTRLEKSRAGTSRRQVIGHVRDLRQRLRVKRGLAHEPDLGGVALRGVGRRHEVERREDHDVLRVRQVGAVLGEVDEPGIGPRQHDVAHRREDLLVVEAVQQPVALPAGQLARAVLDLAPEREQQLEVRPVDPRALFVAGDVHHPIDRGLELELAAGHVGEVVEEDVGDDHEQLRDLHVLAPRSGTTSRHVTPRPCHAQR